MKMIPHTKSQGRSKFPSKDGETFVEVKESPALYECPECDIHWKSKSRCIIDLKRKKVCYRDEKRCKRCKCVAYAYFPGVSMPTVPKKECLKAMSRNESEVSWYNLTMREMCHDEGTRNRVRGRRKRLKQSCRHEVLS